MVAFMFLILYVLFSGGGTILNKVYQTRVKMTAPSYLLYVIFMTGVSAVIFFLMSGCDTAQDGALYFYGILLSVVAILSFLVSLLSMNYINLAAITVTSNAGLLVIPSLFGFVFLHEAVTPLRVVGIVFVIAAFLISYLGDRVSDHNEKKMNLIGRIIYPLLFFISGCGTVVHKCFLNSGSVTSNEAYLAWSNAVMFILAVVALLILKIKRKQSMHTLVAGIGMKNYWYVCAGAAVGCIAMVCCLKAMAGMDIAIYSPTYSAMYMIFLVMVSRFVFKEKITKQNMISVVLGFLSVICTALE